MIRVHTGRLYPTAEQERTLLRWLGLTRRIYNHFLEHRIKRYRRRKQGTTYYDQQAMLIKWRHNDPAIAELESYVGRDALFRLDRAFKAFFRRVKAGETPGYPRFKSARRWNSLGFLQPRQCIHGNHVRVPKIGLIRCRGIKQHGTVKTLRIIYRSGKWFAHVAVETGTAPADKRPAESAVGVDLGLNTYAALSDGTLIENPRFVRRFARKIARCHRRLCRKQKGSKNRRKAIQRLQTVYARCANARADFTHKLSRRIVDAYDLIAVEKLNVAGMSRGRLAKSILDAAWSQFRWQLTYKAESAGATVIEVDPRGTSQECSGCGEIVRKDLSVRVHSCPGCDLVLDRDVNAARNILSRVPARGREFTPLESTGCRGRRKRNRAGSAVSAHRA